MRVGIFYSKISKAFEFKRLRQEAKILGLKPEMINGDKVNIFVGPQRKFKIYLKNERYELPPVIISRLHARASRNNILVQSHIQRARQTRVINKVSAVGIANDKFKTIQTLAAKGFRVPRTVLVGNSQDIEWAIEKVGNLPVVLKLSRGSLGVGVVYVESLATAKSVHDIISLHQPIIVQEYIATQPGVDYRFYIVGNKVIACMKRVSKKKGEFRANIALGGEGISYKPSKKVEKLALSVAKAIGLEVCGVDMIETERGFIPIEINVNAGFEGIEKATNVNVAREIMKYTKNQGKLFIAANPKLKKEDLKPTTK